MQDPVRKNLRVYTPKVLPREYPRRDLGCVLNLCAPDLVFNDLSHKLAIYRLPGAFYLMGNGDANILLRLNPVRCISTRTELTYIIYGTG